MIDGAGIDLFLTNRLDNQNQHQELLAQILTNEEMKILKDPDRPPWYQPAVLFTLKEATLKARAAGLTQGWAWRKINICADGLVNDDKIDRCKAVIHAAATHCHRYSLALIVIENKIRRTMA